MIPNTDEKPQTTEAEQSKSTPGKVDVRIDRDGSPLVLISQEGTINDIPIEPSQIDNLIAKLNAAKLLTA